MATIKFVQLSQAKFNEFSSAASLSASSIYFTTDTRRIYKGGDLYSNEIAYLSQTPANATGLDTNKLYVVTSTGDMFVNEGGELKQVGSNSTKITEFSNNISSLSDAVSSLSDSVSGLESSKLSVNFFNNYSSTTSGTLSTLDQKIDTVGSNSSVTMSSEDGTEDNILKVYTFTQGGRQIGKVNIPKDLVVTSGSVVKGTWSGQTFTEDANATGIGKALKLTIANQTDPVYINTLDLVKDHTGSTVNGITVAISDTNVISVSIADATITGSKIASGTIASSNLSSDVQASLAKADTALQSGETYYTDIKADNSSDSATLAVDMNSVKSRLDDLEAFQSSNAADVDSQIDAKIAQLDSYSSAASGKFINSIRMVDGKITELGEGEYTLATGTANGTVKFNGTDVAVQGLGTAAFTNADAYDAAGAASEVQTALTGSDSDAITDLTLNGLSNRIDSVSSNNDVSHSSMLSSMSAFTTSSITSALSWQIVSE